jgi:hypothetical protein
MDKNPGALNWRYLVRLLNNHMRINLLYELYKDAELAAEIMLVNTAIGRTRHGLPGMWKAWLSRPILS